MKKKVVICASAKFHKETKEWKNRLENLGYEVIKTIGIIPQNNIEAYKEAHNRHYCKMNECDILFILNLEKNNIPNYIGSGVFAEIAFSIGLNVSQNKNIKIYCLNPLPKNLSHSEELLLWEKLNWIKVWNGN